MYIGTKEVDKIDNNTVYFTDGSNKEYTEKQLAYLVTDESKDLTELNEIIIGAVMAEIDEIMNKNDDELTTAGHIMKVIEDHDITKKETQTVAERIGKNIVERQQAYFESVLGDKIAEFKKEYDRGVAITEMLRGSYDRIFDTSISKMFGTYEEGEPYENMVDNIRLSHIKKFI